MNIFKKFASELHQIIGQVFPEVTEFDNISLEYPKNPEHGDFSCNCAMVLKNKLNKNPREIAEILLPKFKEMPHVIDVSIAGPGFINFKIKTDFWLDFLNSVKADFGKSNIGKGKKVNVEFVSANPTGPMHVGHSRGAVYGDVLCRLLERTGYNVTREYYVNDAGSQIDTLADSAFIRYQQALGMDVEIPEGAYPGEYLIPVGQKLAKEFGDKLLKMDAKKLLADYTVKEMLELIKQDLALLEVKHNLFISEKHDLEDTGRITASLKYLEDKGLVYRGVLEAPKGQKPELWEQKEQTIFRASQFGDDVDRPVIRSDGRHTYFAADVAHFKMHVDNGVEDMVLILGADHGGYVKRMEAMVSAVSSGKAKIDVIITQLVNLIKDGEPFKMSKRSGNFISVKDVIDEVGLGSLRFVMLSKKNDTTIDFDFDKVKEQSKDNHVFYVQYGSARANSVLRNANVDFSNADVSLLNTNADKDLIKKIAEFPKIIESAANSHEPHRITYYLIELATEFHSFWAKGGDDDKLKFIHEHNPELTKARCKMVDAFLTTLKNGLGILGVEAVERM